ncbi:hypothetical protein J2X16_002568 [Pelomonas aquatica]|uniref:Uncharacterized protein n=1 Tax=Pelomonas aquatica TaxID=431058 RepID=A0ABU1Z9C0_9BURK|nr:hypothetical protein [Pelomonas aquatica]
MRIIIIHSLGCPGVRKNGRGGCRRPLGQSAPRLGYSTAFSMSSTTFFASPNTIMVLSM